MNWRTRKTARSERYTRCTGQTWGWATPASRDLRVAAASGKEASVARQGVRAARRPAPRGRARRRALTVCRAAAPRRGARPGCPPAGGTPARRGGGGAALSAAAAGQGLGESPRPPALTLTTTRPPSSCTHSEVLKKRPPPAGRQATGRARVRAECGDGPRGPRPYGLGGEAHTQAIFEDNIWQLGQALRLAIAAGSELVSHLPESGGSHAPLSDLGKRSHARVGPLKQEQSARGPQAGLRSTVPQPC